MPKKYPNRKSPRRPGWDYRTAAAYFITICTKNRQHFFGECRNGEMQLSPAGRIAHKFWQEIPQHFAHVQLGEFVVMPNHTHGILILSNREQTQDDGTTLHFHNNFVQTTPGISSNSKRDTDFYRKISPKPGSLSVIVGSYKSVCTKHIRKLYPDLNFAWQERFHDNIIRDWQAYENISNYIINNPRNWEEDGFFDP